MFVNHIKDRIVDQPRSKNLQFRLLNHVELVYLIKPFSMDEVKQAIWHL